MGSDAKNLMSDGNVQIVKTGEVIGATQLTEGVGLQLNSRQHFDRETLFHHSFHSQPA